MVIYDYNSVLVKDVYIWGYDYFLDQMKCYLL
jgi:hypothetical protein